LWHHPLPATLPLQLGTEAKRNGTEQNGAEKTCKVLVKIGGGDPEFAFSCETFYKK